jgi:hypothetical protein
MSDARPGSPAILVNPLSRSPRTTHPLATNSNRSQPNHSTVPAMEPEPKRIAQRR